MEQIRNVVGLADVCELMKYAFAFPDESLAAALTSRAFGDDLRACLADAGSEDAVIDRLCLELDALADGDEAELLERLKRGFTRLYLIPGTETLVFPYESPFLFVADGRPGFPSLIGSTVSNDVKTRMREAGVLPKTAKKEPSDSVWNEFEFLSYLYGSLAAALQEEDDDQVDVWRGRLSGFFTEHAGYWLPMFMDKTAEAIAENKLDTEYGVFAQCGLAVLDLIRADLAQSASDVSA